jgi:hypothetical protein
MTLEPSQEILDTLVPTVLEVAAYQVEQQKVD